jgi:uncharacterized alpha-E superfamily protein
VISRVADHCFWFGRYLERTESTARVLFVTRNLALDAELAARQCWHPLIIVSGKEAEFIERFGTEAAGDAEEVQRYLTWDEANASSIRRSARAARENARSIREVVSLEAWEAINELYLWLESGAARAEYDHGRYGFYRHIRHMTQLCQGVLSATMLHDMPLDFISLGMHLERVGQTARILDVHHHVITSLEDRNGIVDTALWLSLLRACSGFEPFMKRHQGQVSASAVAAFLILEPRFPRSVRYGLHTSGQLLGDILLPGDDDRPGGGSLQRLRALDQWLLHSTAGSLETGRVHEVLTHVVDEISAVCEGIQLDLLSYGTAKTAAEPEPETAPGAAERAR